MVERVAYFGSHRDRFLDATPGAVVVRLGHNRRTEFKDDVFLRTLLGR